MCVYLPCCVSIFKTSPDSVWCCFFTQAIGSEARSGEEGQMPPANFGFCQAGGPICVLHLPAQRAGNGESLGEGTGI